MKDQIADQKLEWYREAKFGLFVHWGPYSVAGVEASWPIMAPDLAGVLFGKQRSISEAEYVALPQRFNPVIFEPETWVQIAQEAGMRYLIFTAKHHDGFCMFDAPGTDYKVTSTPYGRDICAQLADACHRAGMRLGFYYSPPDMHHPGYRDTSRPVTSNWLGEPKRKEWSSYLVYMESHLHKLLTDYGEVSVIWFDGLVNHAKYDPPRFHRLIRELSPGTLINDRLGAGYDFITAEQCLPRGVPVKSALWPPASNEGEGLFRAAPILFKIPGLRALIKRVLRRYAEGELELAPVPTEHNPAPTLFQPWEICMTMNRTWAYNPADEEWKSPYDLIRNLIRTASRGGNYLLNVGPGPDGTLPHPAVDRLRIIGEWTRDHGEAIYGTTYSELPETTQGCATRKEDVLYFHVLNWPEDGRIHIEGMLAPISRITLQPTGKDLPFSQRDGVLSVEASLPASHAVASVLAIHE
jgi:alpha-L-fucosidase